MAIMKLKLGKGSSFVKSRLRRFPQEDAVWEADFQPIPDEERDADILALKREVNDLRDQIAATSNSKRAP